jgi:hypothetical protein
VAVPGEREDSQPLRRKRSDNPGENEPRLQSRHPTPASTLPSVLQLNRMSKLRPLTVLEAKHRLRLFNDKAAILRRGNFTGKVFVENHGFTLTFGTNQPTAFEKIGADEDSTLALVTTLRFFVQPRDGISFKQMAELYQLLPVSDEDKENAKKANDDVEGFLDSLISSFNLVIDGEKLTNGRLFDIFMYGGHAHANEAKRPQYERWVKDSPFRPMMETIFEEIIANLLKVIFWFPPTNERAIQRLELHEDSMILGSLLA